MNAKQLIGSVAICVQCATALAHDDHVHGPHTHTHVSAGHDAPLPMIERIPVTLGAAEHTYQSVPGWCKLPFEGPMGNTHGGIVIDRDGLVYFNTDTRRSIMVYKPDGTFVRSFGDKYIGIHSMTLVTESDEQFIYAAHLAGKQIVKFNLKGEAVWTLPVPMESGKYDDNAAAYNPTAVAVAPDGRIYVADGYGRNWIHVYSADREYTKSIGGRGGDDGLFKTCHGLLIDPRGEEPTLLVCDRENRRVQRLDLDGRFVEVVAADLRRPCAMSIWRDLLAVAELEGRVALIDKSGEVVAKLGDNPDRTQWANHGVKPAQFSEGIFTAPHGVCFDSEGNLYVQDWNASGRISKLRRVQQDGNSETIEGER